MEQVFAYGFPRGSDGKASSCNVGDPGSIPGSGRSPGEGNGNPLQYSCLENPMDRGAWQATVHGVSKSRTRLSDFSSSLLLPWHADFLPLSHLGSPFKGYCTVRLDVFSLFFAFVFYVCIISMKSIINLLQYSTIWLTVLLEYLGSLANMLLCIQGTYCINVRSWKLAGTTSISQTKGKHQFI